MADPVAVSLPEGSVPQTAYVVRDIERHAADWTRLTGAGPSFTFEPELANMVYRGRATQRNMALR